MPVKANHPTLLKKIASVFDCPGLYQAGFDEAVTVGRGHGRVETRTLRCTYDLPRHFTGFAGVRQVFRLERHVQHWKGSRKGDRGAGRVVRESREVVYGMTSLPRPLAGASRLLELVRGHWTIESRTHYIRDVTFGEDACQVRRGNLPQVMVALRNATLTLLQIEGHKNIAAARRHYAARPREAIRLVTEQRTE